MTCHRPRIVLAILCSSWALSIGIGAARGAITGNIKSSGTPGTFATEIDSFVNAAVANLGSEDPVAQQAARASLISECENHVPPTASPQYQTFYVTSLGKAMLPAFTKASGSVRVRINIAVVTADVAARVYRGGGSIAAFNPLVQAFLGDKQTAVVLWGMKGAKFVLADNIQVGPGPGNLPKLIVKAVKAHGDAGAVVEEAYNALTLDKLADKIAGAPNFATMMTGILPDLLDVVAWRAAQYQKGETPSPLAERAVTKFLPVTGWPAVSANPANENRTLKVMGEMTCSIVRAVANGNSNPDLLGVAKEFGGAFEVFGKQMANPTVELAGKNIAGISSRTAPEKLGSYCDSLADAMKSVGVNINADGSPGAAEVPAHPALAGTRK